MAHLKHTVTGITLVGGAYRNGRYCAGWAEAKLEDGSIRFLGGEDIKGFDGAVVACNAMGLDTRDYQSKLDNWVKTGKWGKD